MFFYTYVLISLVDGYNYVGWTLDLKKRPRNHNAGLVEATKNRKPLRLVYYEACLNKKLTIKRVKSLKTGYGQKYLKNRLTI